jgi:hypothetical protein
MHNIIGNCKRYIQPQHMFRQINCHLRVVFIRELQVLCATKYTICSFTVKVFYACHNLGCIDVQDYKLKAIIHYASSSSYK